MCILLKVLRPVLVMALCVASQPLGAQMAAAVRSAPLTVSDRAFGTSLRSEYRQIQNAYLEGSLSRPVANRRSAETLAKALSPGGQRFQREFARGVHLDFMRKDISSIVNNALSGNKTNWHGFYRELKIVNSLESPQSPFQLLAAGTRERIKDGRLVEFDITAQHQKTGGLLVIESKDWKIRSAGDLEKAKAQINKIAIRAQESGVSRVAWINRQAVPSNYRSDLMSYTERRGVGGYDRVSTGKTAVARGQAQHIDDVLQTESKLVTRSRVGRAATRGAIIIGIMIDVGYVGYESWEWNNGRKTTRDYAISVGGAGGALAGAVGGAYLGGKGGAAIGSFFGPGPGTAIGGAIGGFSGGLVGGVGGYWTASNATEWAVNIYYEKLSDREQELLVGSLIEYYSSVAEADTSSAKN